MTESEGFASEPELTLYPDLAIPSRERTRRMFRYVVPVDNEPHEFTLSHNPVAVGGADKSTATWSSGQSTLRARRKLSGRFRCSALVTGCRKVHGGSVPVRGRKMVWSGTCTR